MIKRIQFVSYLKDEINIYELKDYIKNDAKAVRSCIANGDFLTVALYKYKKMIFMHIEADIPEARPEDMFPSLSSLLSGVPLNDTFVSWKPMTNVYYTNPAETKQMLKRNGRNIRIGKIAYLFPEKIPSYVYYHKALMDEGLLSGDKYLYISLIDNMLFAYCESPITPWHINNECGEESTVVKEWQSKNPRDHFNRSQTGDGNFLNLEEVFSFGAEEL